jgi:hypothetical protein
LGLELLDCGLSVFFFPRLAVCVMLRGRAEKVSPLLVPPSFGGLDEGRRLALFVKNPLVVQKILCLSFVSCLNLELVIFYCSWCRLGRTQFLASKEFLWNYLRGSHMSFQ